MRFDFDGLEEAQEFQAVITRGLGLIVPADLQTLEAVFKVLHHLIQSRGDARPRDRKRRAQRPAFAEDMETLAEDG